MPLKHRWTRSGRRKQTQDELDGWIALRTACVGTAMQATIDAIVTGWAGGVPTGFDPNHPSYPDWRKAHERATQRARRERQRRQEIANRHLPPVGTVRPCQIDPATHAAPRPTLRIAILYEATSTANGTSIAGRTRRTTAQVMDYLESTLHEIEDELLVRARHREEQDLRALNNPPVYIFVGPEWWFRLHDRPHTAAERAAIVNDLEALSRTFYEWLLIPGSIYWTPDPLANQTVRVYNEQPILFAGSVIATRTKFNTQDIDGDMVWYERWGPDQVGGPAAATPNSLNVCVFHHKGYEFCVDICRDHAVGEAVHHYVTANQAGAQIYVLTSNGTTITDGFLPVRNGGVAIYCDGGGNVQQVSVVNRPVPLTDGGLQGDFNAYWAAFQLQKPHSLSLNHETSERQLLARDPAAQAFLARYRPVFANPTSDAPLRAIIDPQVALTPALPYPARYLQEEGLRVQALLAHGSLPTGTPISAAEQLVMAPYATACINAAAAHDAILTTSPAAPKQTYLTNANATRVATGVARNRPNLPLFRLYDLIDAP